LKVRVKFITISDVPQIRPFYICIYEDIISNLPYYIQQYSVIHQLIFDNNNKLINGCIDNFNTYIGTRLRRYINNLKVELYNASGMFYGYEVKHRILKTSLYILYIIYIYT